MTFKKYASPENYSTTPYFISNYPETFPFNRFAYKESTVDVYFNVTGNGWIWDFSMGVWSIIPDTSPNIGTITGADFWSTGGTGPMKYRAKTETFANKMWNDPVLLNQKVYFSVYYRGTEVFRKNNLHVTVYNRHKYMADLSPEVPAVRGANCIEYADAKFGLNLPYYVTYDANLGGNVVGATTPTDGSVSVGPGALISDRFLASVMVHENVHHLETPEYRSAMYAGRIAYIIWTAGGRIDILPDNIVTCIRALTAGEKEASYAQIDSAIYQYMDAEEKGRINGYIEEMQQIDDDLTSHGY